LNRWIIDCERSLNSDTT